MNDRRSRPLVHDFGAAALSAMALGVLAVGILAIARVAMGRLTTGREDVGEIRFRDFSIENLDRRPRLPHAEDEYNPWEVA